MKKWVSFFPWICLAAWSILRLAMGLAFYPGDYDTGRTVGVFSNLLFILLVIFVAIIQSYKTERESTSFLFDVKNALGKAMRYVVGVVIVSTVYYSLFTNELAIKREKDVIAIAQALDTEEEIIEIKKQNEMLKDLSTEQIYNSAVERANTFTSVKVISSASFIALTLVSVAYSLLGVFLFRNFLKKKTA
ncbi:MAG: hypothetical protein RLZZ77_1801 [Bacteroidota bacterium]